MSIAQSMSSPKRSKQPTRSSEKPLAGPGAMPSCFGEALVLRSLERVPHGLTGVAEFVGIVEHQQVEMIAAAAFELFGSGHADETGVAFRPAQFGIGETRVAARALPLAFVEIMADHAHQAVACAVDAFERHA